SSPDSPDDEEQQQDIEDVQNDSNMNKDQDQDSNAGEAKRPRLRLAHACDRCRKRKIRCDTQQPCGPCQATKNECTFHTPSRRIVKPKSSMEVLRSSTSGIKRPHSPPNVLANLTGGTNLEARLAALESMLRDVPPNVHNAFLSSLDARLGSGTGVGIKEGKGEGVGVALEALMGSNSATGLRDFGSVNAGSSMLLGDWGDGWKGLGSATGMKRRDDGVDQMAKRFEGTSFFYEDEIGQAKWQGATSGFPLLNILTASNTSADAELEEELDSDLSQNYNDTPVVEPTPLSPTTSTRRTSFPNPLNSRVRNSSSSNPTSSLTVPSSPLLRKQRFFPDRTPRPHQTLNPEASWKVITGVIPPDVMDTLVRCYLSTSHLLWPFLHVPTFLRDYANPQQWGEPGFACFIVAVCTLSSRHVDDPRVRAVPTDPSTAGKAYFELFKRLRDLPSADRPTLYSIQAAFLAAIYAFGLGNLSKAFSLQAESITLCLDGGLHRSVDGYDHFDAVEREVRKRTFWAIYSWDKQSAALFGRPPIIHLRDCDVTEPLIVDDDSLTPEGVKEPVDETTSRMCAFVSAVRLHVILEGVLDAATQPSTFPTSPFLAKAAAIIARRSTTNDLGEEEALLAEWQKLLPRYWQYDSETATSRDPIRITQAERLHCLEHLVKMIIYRHRFSGFVAVPASTTEDRARHMDFCRKAMQSALTIIADHVHISQRGMMTYYGVHVIHQLAQAGRTLVAVVLNCRNADFRPLIAPSIDGLRSCVGLLRRFSGRYLCGLRSADIIDEFCRICNIPVDSPRVPDGTGRPSPAWLRPVRRRPSPSPSAISPTDPPIPSLTETPAGVDIMSAHPNLISSTTVPTDLEALFNAADYFDISVIDTPLQGTSQLSSNQNNQQPHHLSMSNEGLLGLGALGEASAPFDRLETLTPD
ncbi:hypothetical protein TREMEDRAFT_11471, partial [Tremella mesenterica DSM 1558]|uniref:uncharacterized protein n=1 Tax=Tremella mesenterica (strain ATCC 24925 / CBS 8224 / DSM 1558 / NBRC 9311 / NRRL Y-6157 / RJB 2259-6 / UBC 559-6) TaxID=578456 RepID=UPI0003F49264